MHGLSAVSRGVRLFGCGSVQEGRHLDRTEGTATVFSLICCLLIKKQQLSRLHRRGDKTAARQVKVEVPERRENNTITDVSTVSRSLERTRIDKNITFRSASTSLEASWANVTA